VRYQPVSAKTGVETPVQIVGTLGNVQYFAHGEVPLILDCRMAVALHQIGPVLQQSGITRVRFSGAYSYRTTRKGRLSLHAYGLAIDIHELFQGDRALQVKQDFARGLPGPCAAQPPLNRIACQLKQTGLFRELLTPDSDQWHQDHVHLGLAPLGKWSPEVQAPRTVQSSSRSAQPPAAGSGRSAAKAGAAAAQAAGNASQPSPVPPPLGAVQVEKAAKEPGEAPAQSVAPKTNEPLNVASGEAASK
jgi:hypothetical protein